jgi:hypothetical protein
VDLVPPAAQTTCVSGRVIDAFAKAPLAFATVEAQDGRGIPYGPPVQADPQGLYSLGDLPLGTPIQVRAIGGGLVGLVSVTTGTAPGEAGTAACTPVPDIFCAGPL